MVCQRVAVQQWLKHDVHWSLCNRLFKLAEVLLNLAREQTMQRVDQCLDFFLSLQRQVLKLKVLIAKLVVCVLGDVVGHALQRYFRTCAVWNACHTILAWNYLMIKLSMALFTPQMSLNTLYIQSLPMKIRKP